MEGPGGVEVIAVGVHQGEGALVSPDGVHTLLAGLGCLVQGQLEAVDGCFQVTLLSQQLGCLAVVLLETDESQSKLRMSSVLRHQAVRANDGTQKTATEHGSYPAIELCRHTAYSMRCGSESIKRVCELGNVSQEGWMKSMSTTCVTSTSCCQ